MLRNKAFEELREFPTPPERRSMSFNESAICEADEVLPAQWSALRNECDCSNILPESIRNFRSDVLTDFELVLNEERPARLSARQSGPLRINWVVQGIGPAEWRLIQYISNYSTTWKHGVMKIASTFWEGCREDPLLRRSTSGNRTFRSTLKWKSSRII